MSIGLAHPCLVIADKGLRPVIRREIVTTVESRGELMTRRRIIRLSI